MTTKKDKLREKQDFFMSSILDNLPFEIWFKSKDGTYSYVNHQFAADTGKERESLLGKGDYEIFDGDEALQYSKTDEETFQGKGASTSEFYLPNRGHRKEYKKPIYDNDNEILGLIGYSEDITQETELKIALAKNELRFRTIFETAPLGMAVFEANSYRPVQMNQRYADATGYTMKQAMDMSWEEYTHPDDLEENKKNNALIAEGKISSYSIEKRFIHPDGKIVWVNLTVAKYVGEKGFNWVICMVDDITMRKNTEAEVNYLSYYDALTGLYNRRYYMEVLPTIDKNGNLPISIIMADVNGLKLTNDAFGHSAGDALLKRTADIMKNVCRDSDTIARIGGDEFVVLLPNTGIIDAEAIVRRIQAEILYGADEEFNVVHSVSFGWAEKANRKTDIMHVLKQAEDDMYSHKLTESTRMRRETIRMITKRMRENNGFELKHSHMVKAFSVDLGREVGLTGKELLQLKTAAFLHDIGKSGFDETLSKKEGKLSETDWNAVMKHPETGYQILRASNEFNQIAAFVLHHHERIDGSGYPSGLKGSSIPLQSKIISIAEAYAIMISGTTYQEAVTESEAIEELKKNAGTQFDEDLVKIFVEKVLTKEGKDDEKGANQGSGNRRRDD